MYLLAVSTAPGSREGPKTTPDAVTQPYTFIVRGNVRRNLLSNVNTSVRRKRKNEDTRPRSPRSFVTVSGSRCSSTQRTQDTDYGIVPELSASQGRSPCYVNDDISQPEIDEKYSMFSREPSPPRLGAKDTFGASFKKSALLLASEFRETSPLLIGMKDTNIPDDKVSLLVLEAVTARAKSVAPTRNVLRHVDGLLQFYLDARSESNITLSQGRRQWYLSMTTSRH